MIKEEEGRADERLDAIQRDRWDRQTDRQSCLAPTLYWHITVVPVSLLGVCLSVLLRLRRFNSITSLCLPPTPCPSLTHARTCPHAHPHTHARTHTCKHIHTHTNARTHRHSRTGTHSNTRTCIHTQIHAHTHTLTHTPAPSPRCHPEVPRMARGREVPSVEQVFPCDVLTSRACCHLCFKWMLQMERRHTRTRTHTRYLFSSASKLKNVIRHQALRFRGRVCVLRAVLFFLIRLVSTRCACVCALLS